MNDQEKHRGWRKVKILALFLFLLLVGFYLFREDIQNFTIPSWREIKTKVINDCDLVVKEPMSDSDIKKEQEIADIMDAAMIRERSSSRKLTQIFLMSVDLDNPNSDICFIGWVGELDKGKAVVFYKSKNGPIVRTNTKAPLR